MLFNKHTKHKGLGELFSNDNLARYLDSLEGTEAHNDRHVWQWVKIRSIEKDSLFMSGVIANLPRGRIGRYIYTVKNTMIERYDPAIVPHKNIVTDTLRKIGTFDFDVQKKGIVNKIE